LEVKEKENRKDWVGQEMMHLIFELHPINW